MAKKNLKVEIRCAGRQDFLFFYNAHIENYNPRFVVNCKKEALKLKLYDTTPLRAGWRLKHTRYNFNSLIMRIFAFELLILWTFKFSFYCS